MGFQTFALESRPGGNITVQLSLPPSLPPSMCDAGLVLMALAVIMVNGHGYFLAEKTGMMTRVMLTNAIYQKVSHRGR